mmetsp:Transcript_85591/g.228202  ORF Transcript_85591/g.228202 Transcript_85591/m.228202 type:complete len:257 (-) Transcript_85591:1305-2075(-)
MDEGRGIKARTDRRRRRLSLPASPPHIPPWEEHNAVRWSATTRAREPTPATTRQPRRQRKRQLSRRRRASKRERLSAVAADDGHVHRVVHLARNKRGDALLELGLANLGCQALSQALLDHGHRHVARHLANAVDVGEGPALGDLCRRHRVGAGRRGQVEHLVGDLGHARHRGAQADAGEDVHVVALRGDDGAAVGQLHRGEGAARRHHGAPVSPAVRLLRGALRLGRRVTHWHYDGRLVDLSHAADDGLVEDLRHR